MAKRGEITVFLSMCLLCVTALLCVMVESARTAGSRYYFQAAANASLDTLFSQYHRQLWEKYRIFGLEYESEQELTGLLEDYVNRYLEVENWYPMKIETLDITQRKGMADQKGDYLAREVLSYMKFGIAESFSIEPEEGGQFLKDIREGAAAGSLTQVYEMQEKEVRKLEQAVEKICENVERQENYGKEIEQALDDDREEAFYKAASGYKEEAEKYPELMADYDKQAAKLAEKQEESLRKLVSAKVDLQNDRGQLIEKQWNPYEAYIREDGARRREFLEQQAKTEGNLILLEETEDLVEALIAEAEAETEAQTQTEDEAGTASSDEFSLEEAADRWDQFLHTSLLLQRQPGNQEKRNWLDQVQKMAGNGLINLVMPEEKTISEAVIDVGDFPSRRSSGQTAGLALRTSSGQPSGSGGTEGGSIIEKVLIDEYCGHFFVHACSKEVKEVQYELEYLLQGYDTDRENLEKTINELFVLREGLNLVHILSDGQKRQEARALALAVTGAVGMAPLAEITACLIMGIWAMGESVQDLRTLMAGGKVPLWKSAEEWNLSLEALLDMGREGTCGGQKTSDHGFDYESYLKLLLLKEKPSEKHMRMLDMIQMNISAEKPGFSIEKCVYQVDIRAKACGKHVFFSLPFVEMFTGRVDGYLLEAVSQKAY